MGDGFVGQGFPDDADLPDSPDGDDGVPPDLEDAADEDPDAQAADGTEDTEAGEEGEEDLDLADDDGTGDDGASPAFDKLLKKYGGNKEAMAQAYMDQANSMSDLVNEFKSLREFVQQQSQQPSQPKISEKELTQRIAESPEVVEVSEELASIEEEIKEEQRTYSSVIQELGKAEKEVARLEGKLEAAYDENKPAISAELATAQAKMERLTDKFRTADRDIKKLSANFKRTQRRMEKAEKAARSEIDNEVKQQRKDESEAQEVRREFASAMLAEAKDKGLDPKSEEFQELFETVQSRIWAYTQTLPEDADPINIPMAVKILVDKYTGLGFGKRQSFQSQSRNKRKATSQHKGTPPADDNSGRTPNKGKRPMTAADWDRRAARLLGG
jgi:septation ring formation regulator EzrA